MSTYYKHKRTESARVPYSFQCEQCMKGSGQLTASITGAEAIHSSNYQALTMKETEKLTVKAHKNLVKRMQEVYQDATQKQIFATEFSDTCPHCGKPQSWGLSGMKKNMWGTPISYLIVGVIISIITYVYAVVEEEPWAVYAVCGIMGIALLAAVGSLIVNLIKISAKNKKVSTALQKNVPVIDWGPVQNLLNEG